MSPTIGRPGRTHARHISSLMRQPLIELAVDGHRPTSTSAPVRPAGPSRRSSYGSTPIEVVRHKNLSSRLSKPFTFLRYEELEAREKVAPQDKDTAFHNIISIGADDASPVTKAVEAREWIPHMLRKPISLGLCAFLILLIILLEVFDALDRNYTGFAVNSSTRNLARYFPTVIVVCLAFFWDMVLKNLKELGPWSLMARGWTKAEDALCSVNYVDALDIKGFFLSVKIRQFGIALGYSGALLCGGLVPFANNLFFTDPVPRTTTIAQPLVRTSQLLVNDSLTGNGGVTQNSSYFDPQSFLTFMATSRESYEFPDWTIQEHAFDSFNISRDLAETLSTSDINITIKATTSAFSINTTCDPLAWTFYDGSAVSGSYAVQIRLIPDPDDLESARCNIHPGDYPRLSLNPDNVTAWFNYTTCGKYQCPSAFVSEYNTESRNCGEDESNDLRLTVNLWNPGTFNGNLSLLSNSSATVSGLLCKIGFSVDEFEVEVDARTARLISVGSTPISSTKLDIKNPESIVLKINQFLRVSGSGAVTAGNDDDYRFPQEVFLEDPLSEAAQAAAPEYFDSGEIGYFPGAVRPGSNPYNEVGVDKFILLMSRGNNLRIANYVDNMSQMQNDLSALLQQLVSQIVNTEYRRQDERSMNGTVTVSATVIRLRQVSLRMLQALLGLLAIITLLSSTKLRPRTHLRTDPRSLGAIGIMISRNETVEKFLQDTGSMPERTFLNHVRGHYVRTAVEHGRTILELQDSGHYAKTISPITKRLESNVQAYRQVSLHKTFRITLVVAVTAMVIALGISWWRNDQSSGYTVMSRDGTYAIIFFPATLLVLLGYAAQAVDSAIQSLQPYVQLSKNPQPAKVGLGFTPLTYSVFTIGYRSYTRSKNVLIMFSSIVRVLIPTIKIVAAALFITELRPRMMSTSFPLDASLVWNLDTYNLTNFQNSNAQEELLRARAMTLLQSAPSDHTASAPVGLSDGLVFSNVTNRLSNDEIDSILNTGADVKIRIPAIQVIPWCDTFGTINYGNFTPWEDVDGNPTIKIICNAGPGLEKCPSQSVDKAFNTSSTAAPGNEIEYFWNRDFLVGSHNLYYDPESPEYDGIYDLQNVTTFLLAKVNQANSSALGFEVTNVASFWCSLNYTAVDINVTVNRPRRAVLGVQETLPMTVKGYDVNSIAQIPDQLAYNISHLNWTNINWLASFRSIYALEGKNILYNIMKLENQDISDDEFVKSPELLGQAGGRALAHFAAEMINLARPFVEEMSAAQSMAAIREAEVMTTVARLIQSKSTTVALQVLLGLVLICILIVVVGVDTKVEIMRAPNSIGAQAGLMAGSELVRLIREEENKRDVGFIAGGDRSRDQGDKALWKAWEGYPISLGWWERSEARSPNLARSEIEIDTWIRGGDIDRGERRYGIDIGEAEKRAP